MKTLASRLRKNPGDPYWDSVSLLMHCDGPDTGTSIVDGSKLGIAITATGNAQLSTTAPKFGTAAMLLDGTGDFASVAHNAGLNFAAVDWSIEAQIKLAALPASGASFAIAYKGNPAGGTANFEYLLSYINDAGTYKLRHRASDNGSGFAGNLTGGNGNSVGDLSGAWHHVAAYRVGTTVYFFCDGAAAGTSATWATIYSGTNVLRVGSDFAGTAALNGRMDEVRITKGVARYTAAFTAPSRPYPNH